MSEELLPHIPEEILEDEIELEVEKKLCMELLRKYLNRCFIGAHPKLCLEPSPRVLQIQPEPSSFQLVVHSKFQAALNSANYQKCLGNIKLMSPEEMAASQFRLFIEGKV